MSVSKVPFEASAAGRRLNKTNSIVERPQGHLQDIAAVPNAPFEAPQPTATSSCGPRPPRYRTANTEDHRWIQVAASK
jgi:hypothetical protein